MVAPLQPGANDYGSAAAALGADADERLPLRLGVLCAECGLSHLASGPLAGETCEACEAVLDAGGRPALLAWLKDRGCAQLGERQKLASAIAKAARVRGDGGGQKA